MNAFPICACFYFPSIGKTNLFVVFQFSILTMGTMQVRHASASRRRPRISLQVGDIQHMLQNDLHCPDDTDPTPQTDYKKKNTSQQNGSRNSGTRDPTNFLRLLCQASSSPIRGSVYLRGRPSSSPFPSRRLNLKESWSRF